MSLASEKQRSGAWRVFRGFKGYQTRFDPSDPRVRGYFVAGQNTSVSSDGKVVMRPGSELVGSEISAFQPARIFTFKKSDGKEILMRARGTVIEWKHPDIATTDASAWDTLETGFTAFSTTTFENIMRFATNIQASDNSLTDLILYVYFCNANEGMYRWTGAYARYASSTATTIVAGGSTSLSDLGFTATGSVVIDGVDYAYTGLSSQTFTGVTPDPTGAGIAVNEPLAQVPLAVSTPPRGNILISRDSRLIVGGIKKNAAGTVTPRESVFGGSQIGDATNWTISSPRTDGQGFFYSLSSGSVTGFAQDEQALYAFTPFLIHTVTFESTTAVSAMNDLVRVKPIKGYDGKSYTIGTIAPDSVSAASKGILFVTNDKRVGFLSRDTGDNYPTPRTISDLIQPTLDAAVFDLASGIVYKEKYYLSAKKDKGSTFNDTVFVYDLLRNEWELPITGWNVSNWAIVNGELYFGSSTDGNVYKVIPERTDNQVGFTASVTSWQESFDDPLLQKTADMAYFEWYALANTDLTFNLYFDENGFTKKLSVTVLGTENNYIYNASLLNIFGLSDFATEPFGTNVQQASLVKRRVYIRFKDSFFFHNYSWEVISNSEGANFEVVVSALHLLETRSPIPTKLMKAI